ncbi:MAG: cytochrome P450 [Polyangiaceae bacterium]
MTLPPSPKLPSVVTTYRWMRTPYEFFDECHETLGDAFTFKLPGLPPIAVFSEPEVVKHVFSDNGEDLLAGEFNKSLSAFLGDKSVLMADKAPHLRKRRLLLPPFHGERMVKYGEIMRDLTDEVIDAMPLGERFSLHERLNKIALHVIVRNVFGVDPGPREEALRKSVTETLDVLTWPPFLLPMMRVDLGRFSPWGKAVRTRDRTDKLLLEEIHLRRREGTKGRDDVLSLLVDARDEDGQPMSDEELRDELTTLLVAGHETTATAISWAFRWILDLPEVEARLLEELEEARAKGPLTSAVIGALPYLDATCREALRHQPIIPIVGRVLDKPMTIGGYDFPKGMAVVCSIYLAHRRPEAYPDPTRFHPDRFLQKKMTPAEFFPFGGGVRRCIGMAFALYEMKMVTAQLLLRTRLTLAGKRPVKIERRAITLTPSEGLPVKLLERRPREGQRHPGVAAE